MKHKWHKEIKAWADGAEIEYFSICIDEWVTCAGNRPSWHEHEQYRIKPQPKRFVCNCGKCNFEIKQEAKEPQYLYVYKSIPDNYGNGTSEVKISTVKLNNKYYLGKIRLDNDND